MEKILILNKAPPYAEGGDIKWNLGSDRVISQLMTRLAEHGWEVHVLCPLLGQGPQGSKFVFHEVGRARSRLWSSAEFLLKGGHSYRQVIRKVKPAIIYDNAAPFPFPYPHLIDGPPVVTKVHSPVYGRDAFHCKSNLIEKIGTYIGEQTFRIMRNSYFFAVSGATKRRLENIYRIPESNISVFPNGIPIGEFEYNVAPEGDILSLCALKPWKNVDVLLKAWYLLNEERDVDRKLIIAGDGPSKPDLERLAEQLSLNNVEFRGFVTPQEKQQLFKDAYCYVLPTKMEGFGMSNIEAMASGCVVISANKMGVLEYLDHNWNGLAVNPSDELAIKEALNTVLSNPKFGGELAYRARQTAMEYDANDRLDEEIDSLESIIG